ncbi:MAG: hypothetical protein ACI8P9_003464 [Parasphingorhabdus sp.]|jgi:hypothetical protein
MVYLQITRDFEDREFVPEESQQPTLFLFTQRQHSSELQEVEKGIRLQSSEDLR